MAEFLTTGGLKRPRSRLTPRKTLWLYCSKRLCTSCLLLSAVLVPETALLACLGVTAHGGVSVAVVTSERQLDETPTIIG